MRTNQSNLITPAQLKVLNMIDEYGATTLVKVMRMTHDATIYHTEIVIDKTTREELFYMKELMDAIEEMAEDLGN
jgi:hypothetical protein